MKTCFKCGHQKPLLDFYKHKGMADGHLNKCKGCTKSDVASNRASNIDRIREYDRSRASQDHRKILRKTVGERWRANHPDRRRAQVALGNAVRCGHITPWPKCAMPDCDGRPEAHHPDYSKPLDVVWLCPPHHKQAHAMTREINSEAEGSPQ